MEGRAVNQHPVVRTVAWPVVITGLVIVVIGVTFAYDAWKSYRNAPQYPTQVTTADLANASSPKALPSTWVSFKPDEIVYTNVSRDRGGRRRRWYYYNIVRVGSHCAVLCSREAKPAGRIVATATTFDDVDRGAAVEVYQRLPKARWLPYQLDSSVEERQTGPVLAIIAGLLLAFGGGLCVAGVNKRPVDPVREPPPMDILPAKDW